MWVSEKATMDTCICTSLMISLKCAWFFLGDTSFANYIKNEFEALGSLWKILSLDSLKTIGWGGGESAR